MINLEPVIIELGGRSPGYDYEKITEALAAWHKGDLNKHGVFEENEMVTLVKINRSKAEVRLARNGRGQWLTGYSFQHATGGASGPASVWNREAFESREEAIRHEAGNALKWFERVVTEPNSCTSKSTRAEAAKIVEILQKIIKPELKQMVLF